MWTADFWFPSTCVCDRSMHAHVPLEIRLTLEVRQQLPQKSPPASGTEILKML